MIQERKKWTLEEINLLEDCYKKQLPMNEICSLLNRTTGSIGDKALQLGFTRKYMKKNSKSYSAIYQDYNWCYDCFINKGMSFNDMAVEANTTPRTIQKWCSEKHGMNHDNYRHLKKLSNIQRDIIIVGTLGDGHIDKRIDQPMYIESHAEDEKDYLFWKYEYLKDLCSKPPSYYKSKYKSFSDDKSYKCKPYYRINTRIIDDLIEIKYMSNVDKIKGLSDIQISLLFLDDGSRSNLWDLCVAEWSDEDVSCLIDLLWNTYKIRARRKKDKRYLSLDATSSKKLDKLILKNIPNDLDIIKKKITCNNNIRNVQDIFWIIDGNKRMGLNTFCRQYKLPYKKCKALSKTLNLEYPEIDIVDFMNFWRLNDAI